MIGDKPVPVRALIWAIRHRIGVRAEAEILCARVEKLLGEMDRLKSAVGGDVLLASSKVRRILNGEAP